MKICSSGYFPHTVFVAPSLLGGFSICKCARNSLVSFRAQRGIFFISASEKKKADSSLRSE
jgi:hypothetical protein